MSEPRSGTLERQRAERRGRRAEKIAAWFLRAKGYAVLARRYKTPVGEIDLVARRGRTLAFVEVKARKEGEAALRRSARARAPGSPAPPKPGLRAIPTQPGSIFASTSSSSAPVSAGRGTSPTPSAPAARSDALLAKCAASAHIARD